MDDDDLRVALRRHWASSDANDFDTEHEIYRDDAMLEYPQSGERIRGRRNGAHFDSARPGDCGRLDRCFRMGRRGVRRAARRQGLLASPSARLARPGSMGWPEQIVVAVCF
jgi:hypothetical protein